MLLLLLLGPGSERFQAKNIMNGFTKPFRLLWTYPGSSSANQVHGKLYIWPAFLDAYHEVQEAPNKPDYQVATYWK